MWFGLCQMCSICGVSCVQYMVCTVSDVFNMWFALGQICPLCIVPYVKCVQYVLSPMSDMFNMWYNNNNRFYFRVIRYGMLICGTRILGRYAPLILAPAESSSLEPCTLDYLII